MSALRRVYDEYVFPVLLFGFVAFAAWAWLMQVTSLWFAS